MKAMAKLLALVAVSVLVLSSCKIAVQGSDDLEGFDEPEAEVHSKITQPIILPNDAGVFMDLGDAVIPGDATPAAKKTARQVQAGAAKSKIPAPIPTFVPSYLSVVNVYVEVCAGALVVLYVVIIIVGLRANSKIGTAWAKAFACPGGILDRNFSYRGPKETGALLMRESGNVFKFYASGRRYCQGLLAELQLLARQDAISMLWNLLSPTEDQIKIEVYMHEAAMPPIVLAIATAKHARSMQRDMTDIVRYTKRMHVSKEVFPAGDKLWIMAEHSAIFTDLFSDPKIQQLFNLSGPHGASMKNFRSLHVTSENSEGTHKQVLRFVFKIPAIEQMESLAGMMDLVPLFIDIVGTYKLPVDLKKRAIEARAKQEQDDEERRQKRQEALMQKKMEKAQEDRARLLRMTPEARQKAEEKIQRQQTKKAMKSKVVRM